MPSTKKQYDVIFSTDLSIIGLQFFDLKLINISYLNRQKLKKAETKIAVSVKEKIEKMLDVNASIKNTDIDFQLKVSPFQESVLNQLQRIPYGETRTYGDIAKILKTSARAVGNACRNNPLPIIIPCHRVIAATGIGGYDGAKSGRLLKIKRNLLALEGTYL